ncbi:MAG: cysteine--tRNA ligase [Chloroflexi bacterium]|nr:cysteine--tRNA ligase [Chloroflexota bacterium]
MLKLYNTLTRRKEEFKPLKDKEVTMYVCGVTPYDDAHIGHAMSYIHFDVIRRYLKYRDYSVKCVQNVTDIDDKIIERAAKKGVSTSELAGEYTENYARDMAVLNVLPADASPKATEEIPKILEMVKGLVDKGYAYPSQGSVYFRVRRMADYGKLSHRNLDQMKAGARIESGSEKEDPLDFVIWKGAKAGEPFWDSPWGHGRPGWHIECSAMATRYLGETIDIHGGGQDLIFPHHENEIAQSECFSGKPFVRYWLHNGLLQLDDEKMSKSLGNLITIKQAVKEYGADALRLFVLNSHYRSPIKYSKESLQAAQVSAERLRRVIQREDSGAEEALNATTYKEQLERALDDDFNAPKAMGVLFELAREINQAADEGQGFTKAQAILSGLARDIFGLRLEESVTDISAELEKEVNRLIARRNRCRQEKNWQQADEIRDKLARMGVSIEDSSGGTSWRLG